ncbi:protein of unknown function (plasmid) [Cupriavidus taiwanensis]|nr:protein of unknown function [Cupriavidus taiwanensis]
MMMKAGHRLGFHWCIDIQLTGATETAVFEKAINQPAEDGPNTEEALMQGYAASMDAAVCCGSLRQPWRSGFAEDRDSRAA